MASTFPLEVVTAARWLEDPAHKSLSGDALAKALEPEPWDPSVKSLVPFPAVLATMNNNLPGCSNSGTRLRRNRPTFSLRCSAFAAKRSRTARCNRLPSKS